MKSKIFLLIIILIGINSSTFTQSFRSGVFLHHSTGGTIWGPNGSNTSILQEMTAYNTANGYTGSDAVSMNEVWFPGSGIGNEWYDWHWIFDNLDPNNNIYPYLANNKIVVIKSCFPSSSIIGYGSPDDTSGAGVTYKTIYNYKWHWRSILRIMEQHPENFFVIWTNAPLVQEATNSSEALLAHQFTTWAKDTLAAGLDAAYGAFPPNVYVFDFFHKLTNANHFMNPMYQIQSGDSHPNAAATQLVAPQFVNEIFNAAITYETIIPVELTLFSGSYENGVVNLNWVTATEINNFGFEVERRNDYSPYESIGFINGNGTSTNRVTYNFVDENLSANKYYYRLKQIDFDGTYEYSNELEIRIEGLNAFQLHQNYPNPFNPSTVIRYQLPVSSQISIKIYDIMGKEVESIVDEYREAGLYEVNFESMSRKTHLASGIYFYQLKAGEYIETKQMVLMR